MKGLSAEAWPAITLTLQLAGLSTLILLLMATPLAWWLSQTRSRWQAVVAAAVTLPLAIAAGGVPHVVMRF